MNQQEFQAWCYVAVSCCIVALCIIFMLFVAFSGALS